MFDDAVGWIAFHVAEAAEVAAIVTETHRLLGQPPEARHVRDDPASGTRHLFDLDTRIGMVETVVARLEATGMVTTALQGGDYARDQVSFRSPQPGFGAQKLHTDDVPLGPGDARRVVTAIVALQEFTDDNGSTRIVPGSHLRPDLQRRAGNLEHHEDEVRLVGPAGTAFVFSGHLLHSGTRNDSSEPRHALQLVWRTARTGERTQMPNGE